MRPPPPPLLFVLLSVLYCHWASIFCSANGSSSLPSASASATPTPTTSPTAPKLPLGQGLSLLLTTPEGLPVLWNAPATGCWANFSIAGGGGGSARAPGGGGATFRFRAFLPPGVPVAAQGATPGVSDASVCGGVAMAASGGGASALSVGGAAVAIAGGGGGASGFSCGGSAGRPGGISSADGAGCAGTGASPTGGGQGGVAGLGGLGGIYLPDLTLLGVYGHAGSSGGAGGQGCFVGTGTGQQSGGGGFAVGGPGGVTNASSNGCVSFQNGGGGGGGRSGGGGGACGDNTTSFASGGGGGASSLAPGAQLLGAMGLTSPGAFGNVTLEACVAPSSSPAASSSLSPSVTASPSLSPSLTVSRSPSASPLPPTLPVSVGSSGGVPATFSPPVTLATGNTTAWVAPAPFGCDASFGIYGGGGGSAGVTGGGLGGSGAAFTFSIYLPSGVSVVAIGGGSGASDDFTGGCDQEASGGGASALFVGGLAQAIAGGGGGAAGFQCGGAGVLPGAAPQTGDGCASLLWSGGGGGTAVSGGVRSNLTCLSSIIFDGQGAQGADGGYIIAIGGRLVPGGAGFAGGGAVQGNSAITGSCSLYVNGGGGGGGRFGGGGGGWGSLNPSYNCGGTTPLLNQPTGGGGGSSFVSAAVASHAPIPRYSPGMAGSVQLLSCVIPTTGVSATPVATLSATLPVTRTASRTLSLSQTTSIRASASISPIGSPTSAASASATATPSVAPASPSLSITATLTPLAATPSCLATPTQTAAATPSPSATLAADVGGWTAFLMTSEGVQLVLSGACAPPTSRCTVAPAAANSSGGALQLQCGEGYGGFACAQCAAGFFASSSGSCRACPGGAAAAGAGGSLVTSLLLPLLYAIAGIAGVAALNGALVCCATRLYGGSLAGGARRALAFCIYLFSVLGTISQVAQTATLGLPTYLQRLFDYLSILRLEFSTPSVGVPAACLARGERFVADMAFACVALAFVALLFLFYAAPCSEWLPAVTSVGSSGGSIGAEKPSPSSATKPQRTWAKTIPATCARVLLLLLSAIYPSAVLHAVASVTCLQRSMTVLEYVNLPNADGSSLQRSASPSIADALAGASLAGVGVGSAASGLVGGASSNVSVTAGQAFINAASAQLSVSVLAADPTIVCMEGQQYAAWVLGILSLVFVAVAFPLVSALWVAHRTLAIVSEDSSSASSAPSSLADDWRRLTGGGVRVGYLAACARSAVALRRRVSSTCSCGAATTADKKTPARRHGNDAAVAATAKVQVVGTADGLLRFGSSRATQMVNPLRVAAAARRNSGARIDDAAIVVARARRPSLATFRPSARLSDAANRLVDAHPRVLNYPGLAFFTASEYRASASHFRQLDLLVALALGAATAALPAPASLSLAVGKFAIILLVAAAFSTAVLLRRPFRSAEVWKGWVKVASLLVVTLVAALDLSVYVDGSGGNGEPVALSSTSNGLALAVFVACVTLILVLVVSFWALELAPGAVVEAKGEDPLDPVRDSDTGLAAFAGMVRAQADEALHSGAAAASPSATALHRLEGTHAQRASLGGTTLQVRSKRLSGSSIAFVPLAARSKNARVTPF